VERLHISGGRALGGDIAISGSKNACLPVLAATLLSADQIDISNLPELVDVSTMLKLIKELAGKCYELDGSALSIRAKEIQSKKAPYDLVRTMRASFLVLGPLLARCGYAEVSLPGGCAIGSRPVDQHLKGFQAMGAKVDVKEGYVIAETPEGLQGAEIYFDKPTVGGTENIMMAASLASGTTNIFNAATEPEVKNLGDFLCAMGADVSGHGSNQIKLKGCTYKVPADRIEAGTFMVAAAATRGQITINGADPRELEVVTELLRQSGAEVETSVDKIRVSMEARPRAVDIETAPFPGFPTDLQAQFMVLNSVAKGKAFVREQIFENRFMHVQELIRMGAKIELRGSNMAVVTGRKALKGAPVMATDLRASSSLVIGGLVADGETIIDRIYHIDRGYEAIEKKLSVLGASVRRIRN
jgi:UDP-N-acetylglucosamine 1-carboxyvinyltransferase